MYKDKVIKFIPIGGNLIKCNSLTNIGDNWQKTNSSIVLN